MDDEALLDAATHDRDVEMEADADIEREGRRGYVTGIKRHGHGYDIGSAEGRAWDRGYLAVSANPTVEPGWTHLGGCVCGRCDGLGGNVNGVDGKPAGGAR